MKTSKTSISQLKTQVKKVFSARLIYAAFVAQQELALKDGRLDAEICSQSELRHFAKSCHESLVSHLKSCERAVDLQKILVAVNQKLDIEYMSFLDCLNIACVL